jgi:hypothetical protein
VVQIRWVRLSDDMPLSFDETYLPEELGRKVMTDDLTIEPIFTLLEERYDTPLVEAEYILEATVAEPAVAFRSARALSAGRSEWPAASSQMSVRSRLSSWQRNAKSPQKCGRPRQFSPLQLSCPALYGGLLCNNHPR